MKTTAEEFIRLRYSDDLEEQYRAGLETADLKVWLTVIEKYPESKSWVIHNKTIQIEILELLSEDADAKVREAVARKRKINQNIKHRLFNDPDEQVRYALINNPKLSPDELLQIKVEDSDWLKEKWNEAMTRLQNTK